MDPDLSPCGTARTRPKTLDTTHLDKELDRKPICSTRSSLAFAPVGLITGPRGYAPERSSAASKRRDNDKRKGPRSARPCPTSIPRQSQKLESGGGLWPFDLRATRARFHNTTPRRTKFIATIPACTPGLLSMKLLHLPFRFQVQNSKGKPGTCSGFRKSLHACLLNWHLLFLSQWSPWYCPTWCAPARHLCRRTLSTGFQKDMTPQKRQSLAAIGCKPQNL